jgi:hypothetical protein
MYITFILIHILLEKSYKEEPVEFLISPCQFYY